jgi:hypothetical protein
MIVEERIYTVKTGKMRELLSLYEKEGYPVQTKILGRMLGFFTTEFGPLNQLIHMWGYESFEDRAERRARLFADPTWLAYIEKSQVLVERQENKVLIPTHFSPIR